ncbi:MAG: hypothetical protein MI924_15745 [Chloroflexales bacterium]|nr:hypothetical protein [Chloroflexales bacterium]
MIMLVAYDKRRATEFLRDWTPQQLLDELHAGRFGSSLSVADAEELATLVYSWVQRALGPMSLRDALLVDPRRGARVYDLICATMTAGRYPLPPEIAQTLTSLGDGDLPPQQIRSKLQDMLANKAQADSGATSLALSATLNTFIAYAEREGLSLACYDCDAARYPYPANLDELLPQPPPPLQPTVLSFEHPSGKRRAIAMFLALSGVALLGLPLLTGRLPSQPAGIPLALLTLALLFGIKAGWQGYAGSICIWLVANLPGFHHGTMVDLWLAVPLLVAGVILLALDRRIRVMWRWIRNRGRE